MSGFLRVGFLAVLAIVAVVFYTCTFVVKQTDSAIVLRAGRLAGIITETDVCRALGEVLERRFGPGGGEAA